MSDSITGQQPLETYPAAMNIRHHAMWQPALDAQTHNGALTPPCEYCSLWITRSPGEASIVPLALGSLGRNEQLFVAPCCMTGFTVNYDSVHLLVRGGFAFASKMWAPKHAAKRVLAAQQYHWMVAPQCK